MSGIYKNLAPLRISWTNAVALLLLGWTVLFFQGCAPKLNYYSLFGDPELFRQRCKIEVLINDAGLDPSFRNQTTKTSIVNAIKTDLQQNLFNIIDSQNYEMKIVVSVKKIRGIVTNVPIFFLSFYTGTFLLGVPLIKIGHDVDMELQILTYDGFEISNFNYEKKIEGWLGLYYGWKYRLTSDRVLKKPMENLKQQIIDQRYAILQKLREHETAPAGIPEPTAPIVSRPVEPFSTPIDVDINIPETEVENHDAIAVIIGNQHYSSYSPDVPDVDFAIHDAEVVKNYVIQTLGYREGNIIYETDATLSDLRSIFGIEGDPDGRLAQWVKPGKSDVFIYYSGHGAPDIEERKSYFVPVGCHPEDVRFNGYPLDLFYHNLSQIEARSIMVFIDACFSGGSQKGMLISAASPITIHVTNPVPGWSNGLLFTSSSSEEVSSWYPEKMHGLFTYFFLKGLQGDADTNRDGQISAGELFSYLSDRTEGVPYWARRLHKARRQTPTFFGSDDRIIRGEVK